MLAGCSIKVNVNTKEPGVEELLANHDLKADPVKYNSDGSYLVTIHYDKGGFEKMDLSQAYIAYDYLSVLDQIETITDGDVDITSDLPEDFKNMVNEATGEGQLEKLSVVIIETVDDQTLNVKFTDSDNPFPGKAYYFIIPNEVLTAHILPEE